MKLKLFELPTRLVDCSEECSPYKVMLGDFPWVHMGAINLPRSVAFWLRFHAVCVHGIHCEAHYSPRLSTGFSWHIRRRPRISGLHLTVLASGCYLRADWDSWRTKQRVNWWALDCPTYLAFLQTLPSYDLLTTATFITENQFDGGWYMLKHLSTTFTPLNERCNIWLDRISPISQWRCLVLGSTIFEI